MTVIGYILLPIGLAGLLLSKKWLYRLFVFSTLFSASSVVNVGDAENGSAVQVWMFFGFMWLLRITLDNLSRLSFSVDRRILRACLWLLSFAAIASVSLIMPIYISGRLFITSPFLFDNSAAPLYFTSHNITQLLYLIFGITIAICVAHFNTNDDLRQETEKIILLSAFFISLWGGLQFTCNVTGIPYPDFIFNNSGSVSAKGFLETLSGLGRISSVAVEPSMFAQSLVTLLPLTIPAWLKRGSVISTSADRACSVFILLLLILSTSSTAYLGLFVFATLLFSLLLHAKVMSKVKASFFAIIAFAVGLVVIMVGMALVPVVRDVVNSAVLNKSTSGSAFERLMTIQLAFGYFLKFPVLGIGWGSATSHDLLVKLLSNVGLLGTVAFLGAMSHIIRTNWKALHVMEGTLNLSRSAWFLSLTVFLFTSILIGFPLAFGNFWLVLGMAMSMAWNSDLLDAGSPGRHSPKKSHALGP
jgi:hypothetical protein